MIGLEINESVIVEQRKVLEDALSTNPKTQKALQKLIRKVITEAREKVIAVAKSNMKNDPRGAAHAVRTAVYKQILGANINIHDSLKAHGVTFYAPPRHGTKDPFGRGGNRRIRSARTTQIMSYSALDRGFILRWINDGTPGERRIAFTHNNRRKVDKWNQHPNTGNRGNIRARHFFRGAGRSALAEAANNLAILIDTELEAILNKKN